MMILLVIPVFRMSPGEFVPDLAVVKPAMVRQMIGVDL